MSEKPPSSTLAADGLAEADPAQLVRLDRYFRVLLVDDDHFAAERLVAAGLAEILHQSRPKPALYKLTAAGLAACEALARASPPTASSE